MTAGQTGPLAFDFKIEDADWLRVTRMRAGVETELVRPTDYTVTGVGDASGGTITLTSGAQANDQIVIDGHASDERAADFDENGLSDTELNGEAEREFRALQELRRDLGGAVRMPRGEAGFAFTDAENRKHRLLYGDGTGALSFVLQSDILGSDSGFEDWGDEAVTATTADEDWGDTLI